MNKIYKKNNYIIITGPDIISEFPITNIYVDKHELTDEYYIYFNSVTSKCVAIVSVPNILKENDTPYTQEEWETFYTVNTGFFFNVGGGGGDTGAIPADQFVDTYSDLPDPTTVIYQIWIVKNPEGTSWLPGSLGGTYYPEGGYASDGVKWIYHKDSYQASQLEVNAGTVTNKWLTPFTFENAAKWLSFVPYVGATSDVDLGTNALNAKSLHVKGTGGTGHLGLKHQSSNITASASESSLGANSLGNPVWKNNSEPLQNIMLENTSIVGATKTKITYDSKGLVTSGADATQDDIADGSTNRSYTNTEKTKLSGIATGATANSSDATLLARANHTGTQPSSTISDFNSATRAQVEAELVGGSNITITPSGTGATRQLTIASTSNATSGSGAYTGTITWGTNAPTTILNNTYEWVERDNLVTLRINLSYNTAQSNQTVVLDLPSDAPIPKNIAGFTGASNLFAIGVGHMFNDISTLPNINMRTTYLRRNTSNNGFEIVVALTASTNVKTVALTIQYFAQ